MSFFFSNSSCVVFMAKRKLKVCFSHVQHDVIGFSFAMVWSWCWSVCLCVCVCVCFFVFCINHGQGVGMSGVMQVLISVVYIQYVVECIHVQTHTQTHTQTQTQTHAWMSMERAYAWWWGFLCDCFFGQTNRICEHLLFPGDNFFEQTLRFFFLISEIIDFISSL